MEKLEQNSYGEKPRTYSKTELACKYLPGVQPNSARRKFMAWIEARASLKAELEKAGYHKRAILFTPAQVAIIFKHLGEP